MRHKADQADVIVIMGVAGSGKSTVGALLSQKLGWRFLDADHFHPQANVEKMSAGIPLTDEDRRPWLKEMRTAVKNSLSNDEKVVLACSALKDSYRQLLSVEPANMVFVYLKGSAELLENRLRQRSNHFMKASMLESQLATLEEPKDCQILDAALSPDELVDRVIRQLNLAPANRSAASASDPNG